MAKIIGVRFRHAGKAYYFDPTGFDIKYNDCVVVETARGIEFGRVIMAPMNYADEKLKAPLKGVLRIATEEDKEKERSNEEKEKEAFRICKQKILEHELDMKLIATEYAFDDSKILFYFTADGRIDFRELVKDLAGIFRRRIELRQIGVRDETKLLGGMGVCGRPLCCHTFLEEFAPVSIKMAKEQNLSLNPAKISGCCGRLMCCLRNESDTYADLKKGLPVKGDAAVIPDGRQGEVHSVNILRQLVKVIVNVDEDEKEIVEFPVDEIKFLSGKGKGRKREVQEELYSEGPVSEEELEMLENEDRPKTKERDKNRDRNHGKERDRNGKDNKERSDDNRESGRGSRGGKDNKETKDGGKAGKDNGKGKEEAPSREQKKFRQAVKRALENQQAAQEEREAFLNAKAAENANKEAASDEAPKKKRRRRHHKKKVNPNESQETTG